MGSILYNFLADSILFNDKEIQGLYSSLTDDQINNILSDYRDYCIKNESQLVKEITEHKSTLKVLSSIEKIQYNLLKQGALYFDQFIINDPLFMFGQQPGELSNTVSSKLGFEQDHSINRKYLSSIIQLLKDITPMVASDYLKILPLSYAFEPPKEIPVFFPVNYSADDLPKEIMEYCRSRAIVKSMKLENKQWRILDDLDLTPGIYIKFKDLNDRGRMFTFVYQEPGKSLIEAKLADYPMNKDAWNIWVFQSINRSAKSVVEKIYTENLIADDLRATYLTEDNFTSSLLTQHFSVEENIELNAATQFMNIELPFLEKVNINELMRIRTNDSDIFTNFRLELERQFRELRNITDSKELQYRKENIIHEISNIQVKKINQKFENLKQKGYIDSTILLAGLGFAVQTSGWSLLASAQALLSGVKTYKEYKDTLVENPSYLLWKVLKK